MHFINRKFVWLILILFVFSFQTKAQEKIFDESVLSLKGKEAYTKLLYERTFTLGGCGLCNGFPDNEGALYDLTEEREAISAFKSLRKKASFPAGKLYGLVGLRILNCDCFNEELNQFKERFRLYEKAANEKINFTSGCIISGVKPSELAKLIGSGKFDNLTKLKEVYKQRRNN